MCGSETRPTSPGTRRHSRGYGDPRSAGRSWCPSSGRLIGSWPPSDEVGWRLELELGPAVLGLGGAVGAVGVDLGPVVPPRVVGLGLLLLMLMLDPTDYLGLRL